MKRILNISVALLFTFATAGVTVSKHYCGGKLASIGLFHNGGCTCGDMADDSNCCRNETEVVKLNDSYVSAQIEHVTTILAFVVPLFHYSIIPIFHNFPTSQLYYPPPLLNRQLSSFFCTFLL